MSKLHCNTSSANLAHIARTACPVLLLLLSGGRGASLNPTEADKPKHVLLIWGPLSSLATYHKGTAGQCPTVSKGCPVSQGTLSLWVDAQPATGNPELFGYLGLHASNQALGQSRPPMWVQKSFRGSPRLKPAWISKPFQMRPGNTSASKKTVAQSAVLLPRGLWERVTRSLPAPSRSRASPGIWKMR